MSYPIIVLHKGNPPYLKECLNQAKFSNPNSRVILLGDESNKNVPDGVEHYFISDFQGMSQELKTNYVHLSSNTYGFEFFCIERWFIMLDFIRKNNIDKFLHIDSDTLLYADFEKEPEFIREIAEVDIALPGIKGTWCNFFQSVKALEKFCNFVISKYKNRELMQKLQEEFSNKVESYKKQGKRYRHGGICDMTFITWIRESGEITFIDTFENVVGGLQVQHNINNIDGCVMSGNIQNIIFINGQPHCVKKTGEIVRLALLHLQGKAKQLMSDFSTYNKNSELQHPAFSVKSILFIYRHQFRDAIRKMFFLKKA